MEKDNVIVFRKEGELSGNLTYFLNEMKRIPGVLEVSNYNGDLIVNRTGTQDVSWPGKRTNDQVSFKYLFVGKEFIETLGIPMREGRSFASANPNSPSIILNETAIRAMGLEHPIGQTITRWGEKKTIVGVVADFHFESFYEKVKPCFLILTPEAENIMVKIKGGQERQVIDRLTIFYKRYNPGFPFDIHFLNQDYQAYYDSETRVSILARYFAVVTVIISCLGLFGLVAYATQQRQKEIGIRKVIGASVSSVILLLSKDFLKLVAIAIVIAVPLAWLLADRWLSDFAYRAPIGFGLYLGGAALMVLITVLTMSFLTVRTALINPARTLKSE